MSRFSIILLFLFLFSSEVNSQPLIEWQRSLGGTEVDCSYSILQTADGGYIVLGHSSSTDDDVTINHGGLDFWVSKLDSKGKLEWQHSYGGSKDEEAYSIKITAGGGYILAGYSYSNDGDVTGHHGNTVFSDCWIVKIDSIGTLIWQRSYGGTGEDLAYSVCETVDGEYVFAGFSNSTDGNITSNRGSEDIWAVKIDKSGNIIWQQSYGGSLGDEGYCIQQTFDNGFIIAGYTRSTDGEVTNKNGDGDAWVLKTDKNGQIEWQQTYGGHGDDNAYSIEQTKDGGFVVAGATGSSDGDIVSNHGVTDFWVLKLEVSGAVVWSKTYGGSRGEWAYCVHQTKDDGYIVCGDVTSDDGDVTGYHQSEWDGWVIKLSDAGALQWEKTLGGTSLEEAYDVRQTSDGGYVFTGSALSDDGDVIGHHGVAYVSDFWVVKLAPPPGMPLAFGFKTDPAALSCMSVIDSLDLFFPYIGKYDLRSVSFSGKDQNSFTSLAAVPSIISNSDTLHFALPIKFAPNGGAGQTLYQAVADILVHDIVSNRDYILAVPVTAYSAGSLPVTVTTHLADPAASAGDKVYLKIACEFDVKNLPMPLANLNIRSLQLVFDYNTDLLGILPNELQYLFQSTNPEWSMDMTGSSIDEAAKRLTLLLRSKDPISAGVNTIGDIELTATLTPFDSTTSFIMSSCRIFNADGEEFLQPCMTLSTVSDTSFTLIPQCGDSTLKLILRNEEYKPFRIISAVPNPVTSGSLNLKYAAHIGGSLSLGIYDITGNERKRIVSGQLIKAGEHTISTDLGGFPSGAYWYKFDLDGVVEMRRFVILK